MRDLERIGRIRARLHARTSRKVDLYVRSGHGASTTRNMYTPMELEKKQIVLEPMNCPDHILIYKNSSRRAIATYRFASPNSAPCIATSFRRAQRP